MARVNLNGQMEENMKEAGKMGNNMVWGFIEISMEKSKKENGKKEKESDG